MANQFCDRTQGILSIHAGISPDRLGQMQRAGIPIDKAAAHVDSLDLWADGRKYRDAYDLDQAGTVDGRWIRETTPWAFTEGSYACGVTF